MEGITIDTLITSINHYTMKKKKTPEVQRFGGTEQLGEFTELGNTDTFKGPISSDVDKSNVNWELQSAEAQSETHLEDDKGVGSEVIIRCFTFGANPEAFKQYKPTKQELFDSHAKGIELALWKDGLIRHEVAKPRITINKEQSGYTIFVPATPSKRAVITDKPKTLSQLAHGR